MRDARAGIAVLADSWDKEEAMESRRGRKCLHPWQSRRWRQSDLTAERCRQQCRLGLDPARRDSRCELWARI